MMQAENEEATHLLTPQEGEEAISITIPTDDSHHPSSTSSSSAGGGPEELDDEMRNYLQSLAFEEDGGDGTGVWAGQPNQTDTNNQNVQDHEWDFTSPQVQRLTALKTWRRASILLVIYLLPIIISLGVITIVEWDSYCETPLRIWALLQNILQVCVVVLSLIILSQLPSYDSPDWVIAAALHRLYLCYFTQRLLDVLWFGWFIAGMVWTVEASGKQCPTTAPHMYKMCLALIVIQVILLSFGVIVCCCACCGVCMRMIISPALAHLPPPAPRGAPQKVIDQLPLKKFSEELGIDADHTSCAICLSDYEKDDGIRFLPCKHHFHQTCIDTWLQTNKSCPFCKKCIDDPRFVNAEV